MNLKEFRYVLAIAEEKNISRAAERLHVAQSSLSQFLKGYERSLGVELFLRTTHGLRITYAGERYIDMARKILNTGEQLQKELWDIAGQTRGRIVFGLSIFRSRHILPLVLPEFSRQYPGIEVKIEEANSFALEEMTLRGSVDLMLTTLPLMNPRIVYDLVGNEEVLLAVSRSSPVLEMAHARRDCGGLWIDFGDLADQSFILMEKGHRLRVFAQDRFIEAGFSPRIYQSTRVVETAMALASVGLGVALVPKMAVHNSSSNLVHLSIGPSGMFRELVLAYHPDGYTSRAAAAFRLLVAEHIAKNI